MFAKIAIFSRKNKERDHQDPPKMNFTTPMFLNESYSSCQMDGVTRFTLLVFAGLNKYVQHLYMLFANLYESDYIKK
jgi:hypothetical protein